MKCATVDIFSYSFGITLNEYVDNTQIIRDFSSTIIIIVLLNKYDCDSMTGDQGMVWPSLKSDCTGTRLGIFKDPTRFSLGFKLKNIYYIQNELINS